MKKIFTLIAMAIMAVSASAQDVIVFENGVKPVDLQQFVKGEFTLQLGKDVNKAKGWNNSNTSAGDSETTAGGGDNIKPFIQQIEVKNSETGEMELKDRIVYISGGANPKDDNGVGYNPSSNNVPTNGTYYMLSATKKGSMLVGIVLNADKALYVTKSDGTVLGLNEFVFKDGKNEVITLEENRKINEKKYGTIEFEAEANETYYVFCTASKLMCFGAQFTASSDPDPEPTPDPDDPTGVSSVKAEKANAASYNLGGQQVKSNAKGLVIKNGKKIAQ